MVILTTIGGRPAQQDSAPSAHYIAHDDEEDDDASPQSDPHAALVDRVRGNAGGNPDAIAYLLRYETMVRQQEAEDMATLAHVRPCLQRLRQLVGQEPTAKDTASWGGDATASMMEEYVSFAQLREALQAMESSNNMEFFATDRQLMMVLRMLTAKTTEMDADVSLTWAEFVQCYKTCIVGMTTLQHLPASNPARARARDRTLSMLSLFEPPSTKLFGEDEEVSHQPVQAMGHTLSTPSSRSVGLAPRRSVRRRIKRGVIAFVVLFLILLATVVMDPDYLMDELPQQVKELTSLPQPSETKQSRPPVAAVTVTRAIKPIVSKSAASTPSSSASVTASPAEAAAASIDLSKHAVVQKIAIPATLGGLAGVALAPVPGVLPIALVSLGAATLGSHLGSLWMAVWNRIHRRATA